MEKELYIPWCTKGFDPTTKSRIRIAEEVVSALSLKNRMMVISEKSQKQLFRPYFSFREFELLENILLLPLSSGSLPAAILLVTESPILLLTEEELERLRNFLSSSAGRNLDHLRETKFKGLLPSKPLEPSSLKTELERILAFVKIRNWKISLFHLDIAEVVKSLTLQGFNLDSLRIFMDLSKLLGSMLSSNGKFLITASGQFLIILYSITSYTEDLLAHQISLALQDFYETSIPMEVKVLSSFVYPDQGENLFDFLKSINVQT